MVMSSKEEKILGITSFNKDEIKLLTVSEVAKVLRVKKSFVYDLINRKELSALCLSERRTRISESAVEEFIKLKSGNNINGLPRKGGSY